MRKADPPGRDGPPRGETLSNLVHGSRRRRPRRPSRLAPWFWAGLVLAVFGGAAGIAGAAWFLTQQGRTPREWAPYLEQRARGHNPWIVDGIAMLAGFLQRMDRLDRPAEPIIPPLAGAATGRSGSDAPGGVRLVANLAQLGAVLAAANPGDVIQLLPGTYRPGGRAVAINRPGTAAAPITLRAARLGDVLVESDQPEAFKVSAPHWIIENLVVRGVCGDDRYCEHAVHVVGAATGTRIRNNRFEDFNAHIKVNGEDGAFPDNGRVEGTTMVNSRPRDTRNPITPIDLVAASGWTISGNFIADFHRAGGGAATYGAFIKGAGEDNVIERNVVLCEWKLRSALGQRIGLSIGGGGTAVEVSRDLGKSGFEQTGGVIRDNLIAFCSDVGIYVNRGVRSLVEHNTLIDTAGILVRFPESTADLVGNMLDGAIVARDGGVFRDRGNDAADLLGLFAGLHPARSYFQDPARLDLRWRTRPTPQGSGDERIDLCGVPRPKRAVPGAFEDFLPCR